MLHDWELYKAVKDNMNELRLKAYDYAAEWKAKYETWSTEIPEASKQNQKAVRMMDKYWAEKRAAEKDAQEAKEREEAANARAREIEMKYNMLRVNLEYKLQSLGMEEGFSRFMTSIYGLDYQGALGIINEAGSHGNLEEGTNQASFPEEIPAGGTKPSNAAAAVEEENKQEGSADVKDCSLIE